jgi:hypothetical protein
MQGTLLSEPPKVVPLRSYYAPSDNPTSMRQVTVDRSNAQMTSTRDAQAASAVSTEDTVFASSDVLRAF